MEKMKQRFANAVTNQLSAEPDSTAKTELVEELSGNLYRRYLDMTAAGMDENRAFETALDGLGDVTIRLADDENAPVRLEGDVDRLEVKVTENGVLAIRQGKTASSSFFFLRGLSSKSGDCEARIPDTEPFTLQYKTTSGEFSSDFPLTRTSRGAIYGGGGTRTYTMTSISGDVELRKF